MYHASVIKYLQLHYEMFVDEMCTRQVDELPPYKKKIDSNT